MKRGFSLIFVISQVALAESDWPAIKKIGNGTYEFDGIVIDRINSKVQFPMVTNQNNGLIEYAIVHENGKIHESLFRTSKRPQIIHASLLLLKARPAKDFFSNFEESNASLETYSEKCLRVEVSWESNGTQYLSSIREMYFNQKNASYLPKQPIFLFTGSRMIEKTFMAEQSGSILGVYTDPDAIINSIESNSDNDDLWLAKASKMPSLEQAVTCVLHLPKAAR